MRVVGFSLSLVLSFVVTGCSMFSDPYGADGTKISSLRPKHPGTKTIALELSRVEYEKTLDSGSKNEIRLIEVFSKEKGANSAPEYRFFGIEKGSVYDLIGLRSLDVLVAASDYVVPGGDLFWQYLQLLRNHQSGSIEIRRDGVPIVFNYSFVGRGLSAAERSTLPAAEGKSDNNQDNKTSSLEKKLEEELHDELS
jgi:hypothetical protein